MRKKWKQWLLVIALILILINTWVELVNVRGERNDMRMSAGTVEGLWRQAEGRARIAEGTLTRFQAEATSVQATNNAYAALLGTQSAGE